MQRPVVSLFAASVLMITGSAVAHIDLDSPTARFELAGDNQKVGPCGEGTPTGVVAEWVAGEMVTVSWTETINHTGHYRLALDESGTDAFTDPDPPNSTDIGGNVFAIVADESAADNNVVEHTFVVPDVECDTCTLQLMQYMANSASPFYYACADVKITSGSASTTTTTSSTTSGAGGGGGGAGGAGVGGDDGSSSGTGTARYPNFTDDDGGGCSIGRSGRSGGELTLLLAGLGLLLARRRH